MSQRVILKARESEVYGDDVLMIHFLGVFLTKGSSDQSGASIAKRRKSYQSKWKIRSSELRKNGDLGEAERQQCT